MPCNNQQQGWLFSKLIELFGKGSLWFYHYFAWSKTTETVLPIRSRILNLVQICRTGSEKNIVFNSRIPEVVSVSKLWGQVGATKKVTRWEARLKQERMVLRPCSTMCHLPLYSCSGEKIGWEHQLVQNIPPIYRYKWKWGGSRWG